MKKYILTLSILATFLWNCQDELDRFPVDSLVEETAYQSVDDLQNGLNAAIGDIAFNNIIAFNSIFTDNCKLGVDNGGQQLNLLNQILNSETGDQGLWNSRYGTINRFNRIIVAAQGITPSVSETDTYNNILAQSYAFRAYLHHELLLYYGLDMMDPNSEGVLYQNFVVTDGSLGRNTTGEVLTEIENDLTLASGLLPASQTDINFVTQDFITFLRARIALYTGNYSDAITHANSLIANYSLATTSQYTAMFNGDFDTTEVVFKFDNVQGFNYNYAGSWIFTGTGGSFIEMSNGLFNELDANDIRTTVLVDPTSDPSSNLHVIGKYPPGGNFDYINDYKAMRISEMYLIRAEAHARSTSPQFGLAAADLNTLRSFRYTSAPATLSFSNLVDAITAIKRERRIELAYEGHRYIDAKRYRNILNVGISRDPLDCVGGIPCTVPVNSEKFTFPVPQGEINANPNMTQAPGY